MKFLSRIWFTSDWHIGHKRILDFCSGTRGHLADLDTMYAALIKNYNNKVAPGDVCYFLGDFSFHDQSGREALSRLHGTKVCRQCQALSVG